MSEWVGQGRGSSGLRAAARTSHHCQGGGNEECPKGVPPCEAAALSATIQGDGRAVLQARVLGQGSADRPCHACIRGASTASRQASLPRASPCPEIKTPRPQGVPPAWAQRAQAGSRLSEGRALPAAPSSSRSARAPSQHCCTPCPHLHGWPLAAPTDELVPGLILLGLGPEALAAQQAATAADEHPDKEGEEAKQRQAA